MIDFVKNLADFILHIDVHLNDIIIQYGTWTYAILFAIIFVETGLVIMPFLPGDSLLFAAGAFASRGSLNPLLLILLLWAAAVIGDNVNYWVGSKIGPRAFEMNSRFFKKQYLEDAQAFYERHGGKTVVLARFIPIVRTFVPFVTGVANMSYGRFLVFNIAGGFIWITLFVLAGYYFGNIPAVAHNFELVILAIIVISILPMVYQYVKTRRRKRSRGSGA